MPGSPDQKRRRIEANDIDLNFAPGQAFAMVNREDGEGTMILRGRISHVDKLDGIPRQKGGVTVSGRRYSTISMIPFSQIRERGFRAHNEGEKIICMEIDEAVEVPTTELTARLPQEDIVLDGEFSFNYSKDEYERIVEDVLNKEICGGEGSSFVTPRKCTGKIRNFGLQKALSIYRRLLVNEFGSYWKFLYHDGDQYFMGATPEKHLTVEGGEVRMNPISGTFRKNDTHTKDTLQKELLSFLSDPKEIDELFMVTDEELKMMCKICPEGGSIEGPLLKEMSQLVHTEYLLKGGARGKDVIDCFRKSMFAPTVTGSPMGNACLRLFDYEKESRRYYSSACMLLGNEVTGDGQMGEEFLDSCITIRTQEVANDGTFAIRVGATLVKDSVPSEEVKECEWKLKASMRSLEGKHICSKRPLMVQQDVFVTPEERAELQRRLEHRNATVSEFWLKVSPSESVVDPHFSGLRILMMNNEDDFAHMLEHILYRLGLKPVTCSWREFESAYESGATGERSHWDLVLVGPGPGDPNSDTDKMTTVRRIVKNLLDTQQKFLAVCLGHQCTGKVLGLTVPRKSKPLQGVQKVVELAGRAERVGFYNSFYVQHDPHILKDAEVSVDAETNECYAVRAKTFVSYQFHPESMLTQNGLEIIRDTIKYLVPLPQANGCAAANGN
ncbi:unnamed protein product [Vitrella brassicaformis CCMP3155]|uniref:anthranilate synthase n=3 Tax=Vitrella brassicaformis TaxID=1169539 RepID=A0A0G4E862_VITBC|nr:unnamed protein product [Vitrella brassicaformis CCMP3155]|eukprot:CEL91683.1 unnamed protein product [Vitrella brassicaformis CCMP3155]